MDTLAGAHRIPRFFWSLGVTPNAVTVLGFLMTGPAVAVPLALGQVQVAGILLIFTLGFDAVDGTLAAHDGRHHTLRRLPRFHPGSFGPRRCCSAALVWLFLKTDQDVGVLLATATLAASLLVSYTRAPARGRRRHRLQGRSLDPV